MYIWSILPNIFLHIYMYMWYYVIACVALFAYENIRVFILNVIVFVDLYAMYTYINMSMY